MKHIIDLYNYVNERLRIDERGGRFTVDAFNRMIKLVQNNLYDLRIDQFEGSLDSSNTMGQFVKIDSKSITGVLTLPNDFYKTAILERQLEASYVKCDIYTLLEWSERMASSIELPSNINPMARIIGGQIEVMPAVGNVKHYYFRKLVDPVIATKIVGDDVVVDDAASVDLEIVDHKAIEMMANAILTKMGISLENAGVAQTAAQNL